MRVRLSKTLPLLLAFATVAVVSSAKAQSSDQSIIFSTPQADGTPSSTPSLNPQSSRLPVLPSSLQAPDSALNYQAPNDLPPMLAVPSNPQGQRTQKLLDERKNWTLMTPAEILGVTPTEDLLKPRDRDAMGQETKPTQLQSFLDRQNQMQGGVTNGWPGARNNSPWDFSRNQTGQQVFDPGRDSAADVAQKLNQYLNGRLGGDSSANRDRNSGWNLISPPAPSAPSKADMEQQQAAMDRFRQLLDPEQAAVSASAPSPNSQFFSPPKSVAELDPNINQPDFVPNPAGSSFVPVSAGIGKPAGLNPLPGNTTSGLTPTVAPAWTPQPPPWLIQGPQPFVTPKRKF